MSRLNISFPEKLLLLLILFITTVCMGCVRNLNYSEHSPSISPDGKIMIFQSNRLSSGTYKIYVRVKAGKTWLPPVPLSLSNGHEGNTAGPFITYDQNYLLLSSDNKNGKGGVDIWISKRLGKLSFSKPENFGTPVNSKGYDGFASISPDGKSLFFIRECPDKEGYKGHIFGIFISRKVENKWTTPELLPPPVNSSTSDFGPIILADGRTLLFSSARPGGFGGYDLYKTEMLSSGMWTEPVNLGPTINTPFDDRMSSVPATGDIIYISRPTTESGEKYRIRSTSIPEKMRQSSVVTVEGIVQETENDKIITNAEIRVTNIEDGFTHVTNSNRHDGKYFFILRKGKKYDVSVQKKGYTFYSEKFDLRKLEKSNAVYRSIKLSPIVTGTRMILRNLYFEYRSDRILSEADQELQRLLALMKKNPEMRIEISGHTDNVGSSRYNKRLSQKRATAVKKYLTEKGIDKNRMTAKGYGFEQLLIKKGTKKEMSVNRRVEIRILSMKGNSIHSKKKEKSK